MMLYDDEELWLSRPENPKPLTDKDRDRRRRLLHALGNQLTKYLVLIKAEDLKFKNNVARQNPITINWEKKKMNNHNRVSHLRIQKTKN